MSQLHLNSSTYNIYKYTAFLSLAVIFMLSVAFLQPFSFTDNSYAESDDFDTTVNVASNLSVSATDVTITDTPEASGSWLTGTSNVVVSTNNATGYKLYISSADDQVDLVNSENSKYKISNLESETTENNFKNSADLMNHYGFTTNNNGSDTELGQIITGTYLPLTDNNNARLINATTEKKNISQTDVTFATKVDRSIPAGEYTNTITFTAIANPNIPTELEDGLKMQEVTQQMCYNTKTYKETGETYTLIDDRDQSEYKVRKLKDGNCWMAQNLRLVNKTISSADSNVSSSFIIPAPSPSSGVDDGYWGTNDTVKGINHTATQYYNNTTYGAYYNWYTATAGSGTYSTGSGVSVDYSICPKSGSGNTKANSWHLPTGMDTGEWYKMVVTGYGYKDQSIALPNVADWTTTPFNLPFSGTVSNGSLDNTESIGFFWSSTAYGPTYGYYTRVDSQKSIDAGTNSSSKRFGFSVRCVLTASS